MVILIRPPGCSSRRKSLQYLLKSASKERRQKEGLPCFVLCRRSGAMAVFTVVERLRWEEVGGGWTGWMGTTVQGSCTMELNAMYARSPTHSKCKRPRAIISQRRAYAPNRLVLMNPDSWEHDMDDLIMEVTICQDDHRVDRSTSPKVKLSGGLSKGAAKGCSAQP